jgi:hypothetical protein
LRGGQAEAEAVERDRTAEAARLERLRAECDRRRDGEMEWDRLSDRVRYTPAAYTQHSPNIHLYTPWHTRVHTDRVRCVHTRTRERAYVKTTPRLACQMTRRRLQVRCTAQQHVKLLSLMARHWAWVCSSAASYRRG